MPLPAGRGSRPFRGFAAYGGTKAFVETFTRGIADEGAEVGIRAYSVAPGAVATKINWEAASLLMVAALSTLPVTPIPEDWEPPSR